jgi:hypothetical protein
VTTNKQRANNKQEQCNIINATTTKTAIAATKSPTKTTTKITTTITTTIQQ